MSDNTAAQILSDTNLFSLNLLRVEAGWRGEVVKVLEDTRKELVKRLATEDLTKAKKAELQKFLKGTDAQISDAYKTIKKVGSENLEKIATITSKQTAKSMSGAVKVGVPTLTAAQLTAVAKGPAIEGSPMADWWNGQELATQRRIKGAIQQGIALGEPMDEIRKRIAGTKVKDHKDSIVEPSKREAQAIVRTATQSISNSSRIATIREQGDLVKAIQWVATLDGRTTLICRGLDRKLWDLDLKPIGHDKKFPGPIAHWGCVPGDTEIEVPSAVQRVYRRPYTGELVTVETDNGRTLTATPNHPVLTASGWVPIGEIKEGDSLVCQHGSGDGRSATGPQDQRHKTRAAEFPETFSKLPSVVAVKVPISAPDFHGDGTDEEVGEIWTDGGLSLEGDGSLPKLISKFEFKGADLEMTLRPGGGHLQKSLSGLGASADSGMSGSSGRLLAPGPSSVKLTGSGASDAGLQAPPAQGGQGDPELSGDLPRSETVFDVEFDRVRVIRSTEAVSIFVHNLETSVEWYFASGIVCHNCRSTQNPQTYSWQELANKKVDAAAAEADPDAPQPDKPKVTFQDAFEKHLKAQGFSPEQIAQIKPQTKASMDGQVAVDLSHDDWLEGKGDDFARQALGPGRYALWKEGKLTLKDLTDQDNRVLTIAQLEAAIDQGSFPPETEGQFPPPTPVPTFAPAPKQPQYVGTGYHFTSVETAEKILAEGPSTTASSGTTWQGAAFYMFAEDHDQASFGGVKIPVQYELQNPFVGTPDEIVAKVKELEASMPDPPFIHFKDGKKTAVSPEEAEKLQAKGETVVQLWGSGVNSKQVALQKLWIDNGYDGIVETVDGKPWVVGAFKPEAIQPTPGAIDSLQASKAEAAIADILANPKGQTLKAKWAKKVDAELPGASATEKLAFVEAKAAADQAAASKASKLSTAKKKLLAGKAPSPSEQATIDSLTDEELANFDNAIMEGVALKQAEQAKAAANQAAKKALAEIKPETDQHKWKAMADLMAKDPDLAFSDPAAALEKIEADAAAAVKKIHDDANAEIDALWKSSKGKDPELHMALDSLSHEEVEADPVAALAKAKAQAEQAKAVAAAEAKAEAEAEAAASKAFDKLKTITEGQDTKLKQAALKKQLADFGGDLEEAPPSEYVEILAKVEAEAAEKQAAASKASKLSTAKKKILAGKQPSPSEQATIDDLTPEEKANWEAAVNDAKAAAAKPVDEQQAAINDWLKSGMKGGETVTKPDATAKNLDLVVPNPDTLVKVKDLPGSTRPYLAKDPVTGKLWVVKDTSASGTAVGHVKSEALADNLYRAAGASVPGSAVIEQKGKAIKVAEFLEGGQTLGAWKQGKSKKQIDAMHADLKRHFVTDALLSNWDVAGLDDDNILVVGDKPIRIDNGGSLFFRAQGQRKEMPRSMPELASLRDPNVNRTTSRIFAGMTQGEIHDQMRQLLDREDAILDVASADMKVRTALKARFDWMRTQLPAERLPAKPSVGAAPKQIPDNVKEIFDAGRHGTALAIEGDLEAIEDHQMIAWRERDQSGKDLVKVEARLTMEGANKVMASLKARGLETAQPTVDPIFNSLLNTAKTVSVHAEDGNYNPEKMAAFEAMKKNLAKWKKAEKDPATLAEFDHYIKAADLIDDAIKNKKKLPVGAVSRFVPPAAKPETDDGWRVNRLDRIDFTLKEVRDGVLTDTGKQSISADTGQTYEMTNGSTRILISGFRDDADHEWNKRSLQGLLRINVDGTDEKAGIESALAALREVGIDPAPPSDAQKELLYLHKGFTLRNDHKKADYKAIIKGADPDDVKVEKVKKLAEAKYMVKLPRKREDWGDDYNPEGRLPPQGHGTGYRTWERWDVSKAEKERILKDKAFYHNSGKPELTFMNWVKNGGNTTTTLDRVRTGVPITDGASSTTDVDRGGGNFLYTNMTPKVNVDRKIGFVFKGSLGSRIDIRSDKGDSFGKWESAGQRRSDLEDIAAQRGIGWSINTGLFKNGVNLFTDLDHVNLPQQGADRAIRELKAMGITEWPDGRPLTEVIKGR